MGIDPLMLRFGKTLVSSSHADGVNLAFLVLPAVLQIDVGLSLVDLAVLILAFFWFGSALSKPIPALLLHDALIIKHQSSRAPSEWHTEINILVGIGSSSYRFDIAASE